MTTRYVMFPLPQPYSFECKNFKDENGNRRIVTAVIVPVTFTRENAFTWKIGYACNFMRSCQNKNCVYHYRGDKRES